MTRAGLLLVATTVLAGCTAFGGTVRGDFGCRAVAGTCSPIAVNDAGALTTLVAAPRARARAGHIVAAGTTARSAERVLTVVLAAHVDGDGVLHDPATVRVVVAPPRWTPTIQGSPSPRSIAPSLRGIIEDASASAMEGLEAPPARAPQPLPDAAAQAAARAGARIARPSLLEQLAKPMDGPNPESVAVPVRPMATPPLVTPVPVTRPRVIQQEKGQ